MIRVAIIGASGYTGAESIRILFRHAEAELTYLTALPEECGPAEEVFPEFRGRCDLPIEPLDMDKLAASADVALCCLPHKVSMGFVPKLLAAGVKGMKDIEQAMRDGGDVIDEVGGQPVHDTFDFLARVRGVKGTLMVAVRNEGMRAVTPQTEAH